MRNYIIFLLMVLGTCVQAQDAQFSQFYAAPLYHNPAFTGTGMAPRMVLNYRNQWPSLDANFTTTAFSFDHHIDKLNSGIGVMVVNDQAGSLLQSFDVSLLYSYEFQVADEGFIRLGLQGTQSYKGVKSNNFVFGDQYNPATNTTTPLSPGDGGFQGADGPRSTATDFSTGALFYSPKGYLGLSAHHLNSPSFRTYTNLNGLVIPTKFTIDAGVNIPISNPISTGYAGLTEVTLTPAMLFRKQGSFSQLDLGAYVSYSPLTFGLWYRGVPIKKKDTNVFNNDALVFLVGFRQDNFSVGYTYDLTVSKLGPTTGGAHEISISYQLDKLDKQAPYLKRKKKALSCPKF